MSNPSTMALRRLVARAIDQVSFIALIDVLLPFDAFSPIVGLALLVAFIPVEALQLWVFGTTLGKLLLGLKVVGPAGNDLSFGLALFRSAFVWGAGQGAGIGLILPITYVLAYTRLSEGSPAFWDEQLGTDVVSRARAAGPA